MESQLILLSAILTPSELRAAGAMSSEASRGRSPASFRSSAPRGSAFDPPAAARAPPHPAPTQETGPRRIRGSLGAGSFSGLREGWGQGLLRQALASSVRQTRGPETQFVSQRGPQGAGLGVGRGWGSREEAEHRSLHLKRSPHPEFPSSAPQCRRPSCSQKTRRTRVRAGPVPPGDQPLLLRALSPEAFFPVPLPGDQPFHGSGALPGEKTQPPRGGPRGGHSGDRRAAPGNPQEAAPRARRGSEHQRPPGGAATSR